MSGVEGPWQVLVEPRDVLLTGTCERVTDDQAELRIDTPMDEEPEALVAEPLEAFGVVADWRLAEGRSCEATQGPAERRHAAEAAWHEDTAWDEEKDDLSV